MVEESAQNERSCEPDKPKSFLFSKYGCQKQLSAEHCGEQQTASTDCPLVSHCSDGMHRQLSVDRSVRKSRNKNIKMK